MSFLDPVLLITADPQVASVLFIGSLILLYAETLHPGLTAPGLVGSIGLILSLMSFHILEIVPAGIIVGVLVLIIVSTGLLMRKTLRQRRHDGDYDLRTKPARIVNLDSTKKAGQLEVLGEIWKFQSEMELQGNDAVEVLGREGLTLNIRKKNSPWKS
jgi:membrane-bound serine protease (ClpP class)